MENCGKPIFVGGFLGCPLESSQSYSGSLAQKAQLEFRTGPSDTTGLRRNGDTPGEWMPGDV